MIKRLASVAAAALLAGTVTLMGSGASQAMAAGTSWEMRGNTGALNSGTSWE